MIDLTNMTNAQLAEKMQRFGAEFWSEVGEIILESARRLKTIDDHPLDSPSSPSSLPPPPPPANEWPTLTIDERAHGDDAE